MSVPQAVNSQEDSTAQAVSTSSPQTVNSEAVSTSASQAGSSQEDSTSQAASTNSQGTSATLPQAPPASRQPNSTNTPQGLQEANHWKTPTLNGSSIYPVNLRPRIKGQYWPKVPTLHVLR